MNQEDRAAVPMTDAFTNTPNLTPYTAVPNQIPLTQGLPTPTAVRSAAASPAAAGGSAKRTSLARTGTPQTAAQAGVPVSERAVYNVWAIWSRHAKFSGRGAMVDWANAAQLNRLDWYSAHNWTTPYPGDATILAPDEVPGRNLPNGYLSD